MSSESKDHSPPPEPITMAQHRSRRANSQSHHANTPHATSFFSRFALLMAVHSVPDNVDQQAIPVLFALLTYAWPRLNQQPLISSTKIVCAPKIYTANDEAETAECIAFEETKGAFGFVGSRQQVKKKYPGATIRDLENGMAILPGLYDSHGHIMHVPSHSSKIQLTKVWRNARKRKPLRRTHNRRSPYCSKCLQIEFRTRIRKWLADNPESIPPLKSGKKWLVGFGWDQNILPGKKYPTAVSPSRNSIDLVERY